MIASLTRRLPEPRRERRAVYLRGAGVLVVILGIAMGRARNTT
jgi:hypothetical protein